MSTLHTIEQAQATPPRVGDRYEQDGVFVSVYARAKLPSRFGDFDIIVFRNNLDDKEHVAIVKGDPASVEVGAAQVRLHSECLTGDVFGSLRCDCRDQLERALAAIAAADAGVILYLRQEGRGIGLGNKVRAYSLQEQGLDTYAANQHLGFDDDLRDYTVAALMLKLLGLGEVELHTNNPRKIFGLKQHGIEVRRRVPIVISGNAHNHAYLRAKAASGHLIPIE